MPLTPGRHLGPYEIVAPLGAGGMGEVYRAQDSRLGRDVAIKVLPAAVSESPDALARFEREARAVALLSHPNILTLHDFGKSDGVSYAVLEFLDGETLRERLAAGPLSLRKAVEVGVQIARGLAAAHGKGIAHRDVKPENVFLTRDGQVKILDFGLARHAGDSTLDRPDSPTLPPATEPGVILGTVGYMSPEQVRGGVSDYRSDIFALGCVLYEMVTGRRAFQRETAAETMTAILKDDPVDGSAAAVAIPPSLERIVRRCLEKRPEERFQSTRDLIFALESAIDGSGSAAGAASGGWPAVRPRFASVILVLVGALAGGLAAWMATRSALPAAPAVQPAFRQLTFERGMVHDARFTPDGQSVIYGAAWDGQPLRVFMTRTDSTESVPLSVPDARLLSISRSGEMALSLSHRFEGWIGQGTLARSSVLGSAPRIVAEQVREAEWTPDGSDLAIVRRAGGLEQLEFPIGNVLYRTSGYISRIRFSPDGQRIAFADHPVFADNAGGVSIVDRSGHRTPLSAGYNEVTGVAWRPDAQEVWFSARRGGDDSSDGIYAATLSGSSRSVWATPSDMALFDIAADGRILLGQHTDDRRVEALFAGASAPVDVSIREDSSSEWIADDGSMITVADQRARGYAMYLVRAGVAPVLLGPGQAFAVSPDGRTAVGLSVDGLSVLLQPTGAGTSRTLPNPDRVVFDCVRWLPDGRRLVLFGQVQGQPARGYVQQIDGDRPQPFTREGAGSRRWWALPVSPDGTRVVGSDVNGVATVYRISDGSSEPMPAIAADEVPVQWSDDGRSLFIVRGGGAPTTVERLDLASGRRTPALEIRARDPAGLRLSVVAISPNGRHYVHAYSRSLTKVFVVKGLE